MLPTQLDAVDSFGDVAAESDTILKSVFEDHPAYLEALSHNKFFLLGRKGSGKSAIYRKILERSSRQCLTVGMYLDEYPWHYHGKQKEEGVPLEQCYIKNWEYLIYLSLSNKLFNYIDDSFLSDEQKISLQHIKDFLEDTYGNLSPDLTQIFSPQYELKMRAELGVDWKIIRGKIGGEKISIEHLPTLFSEINKKILSHIVDLIPKNLDIYVCFDGLDLGSSLEADDYNHRLMDLIQASRRINILLKEKEKRASIVLFLRDDIYDRLRFEDKNKITSGSAVYIRWDALSLKSLMERRFSQTLSIPKDEAWASVFDETKQLPGKQTKLNYIVDRTFLRPRDIISFCNKILDAHKKPSDRTVDKFSNNDIHLGKTEYSQWLRDELDDELPRNIPNYEKYLELLKHIGSLQFTSAKFDAVCKERKDLTEQNVRPIDILKRLFDFSIIGYYRPGGGGQGGSEYVWNYKTQNTLFNEHAASFRTHPGLQEVLGVKKWSLSS